MTTRRPDIRELRPDDDLDAEFDLQHRAFGPVPDAFRPDWMASLQAAIAGGRVLGAFDGSRLVGSAAFHDMRQWWHGRSLPMAGVAGVKVAPEERGRGVGRMLMTDLLGVIAARGYPVSVLYPVTAPIYRSLGWEIAGALYETLLPARSLGSLLPPDPALLPPDPVPLPPDPVPLPPDPVPLPPDLPAPRPGAAPLPPGPAAPRRDAALARAPAPPLRRAGPDDAAEVIAVTGRVHESARDCGPATRDADTVRRWLGSTDLYAYLAPDGFLAYGWDGPDRDIHVRTALAGSAETTRAIWAVVASHASMARSVRARLSPADPVAWLTRELDARQSARKAWMLRLVDAAAAISARGFPAAADLSVTLRVQDATRPANTGLHSLKVSGGHGTLTPFETARGPHLPSAAPVRLGARGLASLYAGVPMATLRRAGLAADGDPDADGALDCAFAGPAFMLDAF